MHPVDHRSLTAPLKAGAVVSSHDQVRLKAGCRHPFKPLLNPFCIQDTRSSGTCILTTSLWCNTSSPTCLRVAPLNSGHAVQKNESSSDLTLIMLSLSSHFDSVLALIMLSLSCHCDSRRWSCCFFLPIVTRAWWQHGPDPLSPSIIWKLHEYLYVA